MTRSLDLNYSQDMRRLQPEVVWLEPEHFDRASQLSRQVIGEANQWQTYLNMLALLGFIQWLGEQVADLNVNQENCSVLQPRYANAIEAVCNLKVYEFNLCLIATESSIDEVVSVPRAALELPEFAAHFYITIEVQEEQEQVIIRNLWRYDQLVNYQKSHHLQAKPDWSYQFPLSSFAAEPNHLLFYLRFLEPSSVALPVVTTHDSTHPSLTDTELEVLLSNLQLPEQRLWQSLTWEQGATVLTCPELLDLLYQWQRQPETTPSPSLRIRELFTLLTQKAVNAARWLQEEMDELAQGLGVFFTPTASALLSIDQFEVAIAQLKHQGIEIPCQARPTYQNINLEGIPLRLCALVWSLASPASPQWSLLLILGTQTGRPLPDDLKLQVSNLTGVLRNPISELDDQFLFAHVEGDWGEKFVVTLVPINRLPLILPPYTFEPEQTL